MAAQVRNNSKTVCMMCSMCIMCCVMPEVKHGRTLLLL